MLQPEWLNNIVKSRVTCRTYVGIGIAISYIVLIIHRAEGLYI